MIRKDKNNYILSTDASNIIVAELKNGKSCSNFTNCISGVFQYNNTANAILISNGKVISNLSAHGWLGYPDSVIVCDKNNNLSIKRAISLSSVEGVRWAVSGVGLLGNYSPESEGYCRIVKNGKSYDYSDVLRKTNHTALGVKDNKVYGFYLSNMTGAEVNAYVKSQGMEFAIMLDGGHIASINCDLGSVNEKQKQHNIIQFVMDDNVNVNVYDAKADGNKAVSKNFKVREFACKDGSRVVLISPQLVEVLQALRDKVKKPVTITSGYRTVDYNAKIGGAENSQHMYGIACDIVVDGVTPKTIAKHIENIIGDTGGIGIYDSWVHVDVRKNKSRW